MIYHKPCLMDLIAEELADERATQKKQSYILTWDQHSSYGVDLLGAVETC